MKKIYKILLGIILSLISALALFSVFYNYNLFNALGKDDNRKIHISIDDTIDLFEDLTKNEEKYTSIFDNYTLRHCKELHDDYGMVFSFYCFYEKDKFNLSMATKKFKEEFINNSEWIKFNYHSYNDKEELNDIDISTFISEYDLFLKDIIKIVGNESFDKNTRLSFFHGKKEILAYMKSKGTLGFFTADDDRDSYYLSKEQNESLKIKDSIQDDELGIDFIHTDLRLDYCVNPFYALFNLRNASNIEIFTHEWLINLGKADSVLKLEEVGRHIKYYGGKYTYSMN